MDGFVGHVLGDKGQEIALLPRLSRSSSFVPGITCPKCKNYVDANDKGECPQCGEDLAPYYDDDAWGYDPDFKRGRRASVKKRSMNDLDKLALIDEEPEGGYIDIARLNIEGTHYQDYTPEEIQAMMGIF